MNPPSQDASQHHFQSVPTTLSDVTTTNLAIQFDVNPRLRNYRPKSQTDFVVPVLEAFLEHIPSEGKKFLVDDIMDCQNDDKLKQLSNSLVEKEQKTLRIICLRRDGFRCVYSLWR